MNTTLSTKDLFRSLCIALAVMLALATLARAQTESTPAAAAPPPAEKPTAADEKSGLHHIDAAPSPDAGNKAMSSDDSTAADDSNDSKSDSSDSDEKNVRRNRGRNGHEIISIGHDSHLAKGETSDAVVSIFGSSTSEGNVSDSVVSVFGDTRVTGDVSNTAVAVLGSTYVNSHVHGEVVAVGGNVELGPDAVVDGDVVAVGGRLTRDPHAVTNRQVNVVSMGGAFANVAWLKAWLYECVLHGRMLGFGPNLVWAWWVALAFLAFYVLLALLFRGGMEKCVETLESRPGYSILTALLSLFIVPIACVLLAITGIGIVLLPLIAAGIVFATLFGKAVMLAWLGRHCAKSIGAVPLALAVLLGGLIVLVIYLVPILAFIVYKLFGWLGMGVVIYTLILGMKREKPASPSVAAAAVPVVPMAAAPVATTPVGEPVTAAQAVPPVMPVAAVIPPVLPATTLTRAGFWHRMAALLLDVILVGIITNIIGRHGNWFLPCLAIYGAVMWKIKGTTIGGIVCGLKVVRLDDRPIDWPTAIVRALGCFLSLVACFLGFIWVAFDPEKQSWHDKIAGTVVVKSPKGAALV